MKKPRRVARRLENSRDKQGNRQRVATKEKESEEAQCSEAKETKRSDTKEAKRSETKEAKRSESEEVECSESKESEQKLIAKKRTDSK